MNTTSEHRCFLYVVLQRDRHHRLRGTSNAERDTPNWMKVQDPFSEGDAGEERLGIAYRWVGGTQKGRGTIIHGCLSS